jgi:hypothetical protein
MKKLHAFNVMSDKVCDHPGCKKTIKLRLVETKKDHSLCYEHYKVAEANRDHFVDHRPRKKRVKAGLPVKQY